MLKCALLPQYKAFNEAIAAALSGFAECRSQGLERQEHATVAAGIILDRGEDLTLCPGWGNGFS